MKLTKYIYIVTILLILALASGLSFADDDADSDSDSDQKGKVYEVTITNLTRGQIFSAPVVISHDRNYSLFTLGAPASAQLYPLAEDALTDPLTDHLDTLSSVFDYTVAGGNLLPGHSMTVEITTHGRFKFITALGMLVTTNDAFFAIRGAKVPSKRAATIDAEAYDSGSEANSEDCNFIPGPPCGSGGARDTGGAEGYVHVHAGVHGIADLVPASDDWRNPVAEITIRPIYK
jgi:hypothetical protein